MWNEKELKLFKEFREKNVKDLNIDHINLIEESAKSFDGRLASVDSMKLIEITKFLLNEKKRETK